MPVSGQEISRVVDEIVRAAGANGEARRKEIEEDMARFLDHGVPIESATRTIMHRFGAAGASGLKSVASLQEGDMDVTIVGKILSLNARQVVARGENKTVFFGFIGDETGTISYSSFKDIAPLNLAKGDIVRIEHAYVNQWNEKLRLNLGDRSTISKQEAKEMNIPAPIAEAKEYPVSELKGGLRNVTVTAKIESVGQRTVETKTGAKIVYSGKLADETGGARFSAWHDFGLNQGDVVRIEGAYTREWQGVVDINFDERCKVTKLDKKIETSVRVVPIREIEAKGGAYDAIIEGVVVDIRPGSGLISRCPQCNKTLQKGQCKEHGAVDGMPDLRIRTVIDDGTGTLNVTIGRELSEPLIGKTLEQCKAEAQKAFDPEVVVEHIRKSLVMKPLLVKGNAKKDDFGLSMIANDAKPLALDRAKLREKAESMLEDMEAI
ncbi:MAG: hypothetical protein CVT47_01310 [Thermoplasmata archaeon HGW-Thermoplasmata-2]|nr:MAG: hypothetical protein CVT47_01310 [Thermoplasmata archaeon HGW-Thermoplasmata-2]